MRTGLPYSGTEDMYSEIMEPSCSHHDLQFRLCAARTGYDERRYALIEKAPFGHGDGVKWSFHIQLSEYLLDPVGLMDQVADLFFIVIGNSLPELFHLVKVGVDDMEHVVPVLGKYRHPHV